jgi:(p)ppGpp synthase/HD superfamily hydrolase
MNPLDLAIQIAQEAHKGQFRRDGVTPYIEHPKAVAEKMTTDDERCVAWLHDVLEDTGYTSEMLRSAGVNMLVIEAVKALTKQRDVDYMEYLQVVSRNRIATRVKVADMICNLNDVPTVKQIAKYSTGLKFLSQYL